MESKQQGASLDELMKQSKQLQDQIAEIKRQEEEAKKPKKVKRKVEEIDWDYEMSAIHKKLDEILDQIEKLKSPNASSFQSISRTKEPESARQEPKQSIDMGQSISEAEWNRLSPDEQTAILSGKRLNTSNRQQEPERERKRFSRREPSLDSDNKNQKIGMAVVIVIVALVIMYFTHIL